MGVRLAAFNLPSIAKLTMTDELHLQELGERKIALFCCIPDSDKSLNYLVGMIYTQLIQTLYRQADRIHKGRLPVPVHCLMDEYANISLPKDTFLSALATMRSRAIFCSIIVQNMAQLNDKDTRMKINILLCDDDKDFLQRISDAVAGQPVPPGASICITKSSNPAEITDRQLSQYHIMFLDIDMDERSGMDIARRVRELHLDTVIVFVTNYPEFSMEGYEVRAFRYLLKQELEQKLANYFRDALAELPRDDKVLRFSASAESFNIPYKDILYLESNQRVIYLYTVKPMQVPDRFYGKMEDLAAELEGDGFLRIQKSYLVNMAYIKKFNYDRVILLDGKELSVSQKRYSQMKVQYLSWKNKNWGNAR